MLLGEIATIVGEGVLQMALVAAYIETTRILLTALIPCD